MDPPRASPAELAARELARTHARYRAELARVDVAATNRDNAAAYERACALRVGGVVWGDLSPTQFELVVPRAWRDRRDSGIDVVTLDRALAVQCKNHAAGTPVSWRHYATFTAMSEAVGMGHAKCLWTNPDTPIDGRVQAVIAMGRVALRREALGPMLAQLGIVHDPAPPPPSPPAVCAPLEVRPYMPKVVALLRRGDVVGQFPCSLGKSYIYVYAFEQLWPRGRLLVVVPSRDLLAQASALLRDRGLEPHVPSGADDCAGRAAVVATYQWLMDHAPAGRFDLVVQDECHHTTESAPRFRAGLERVDAGRHLLLSATPRAGQVPDIRVTPAEAVEAGWVCDYALHCLYVDRGEPTLECVCERLAHSADEWGPTIVYWNSTARAHEAARRLTDELGTPCACLTGDDSDRTRLEAAEALRRGDIKVISVCGVFVEGRSIDEVRTVVFGDTRQSATQLTQIAGRPTRLHALKSHARVVMFTSVDDLQTNRELGGFLRRLAEGDERIAASMREGGGARVRIGPACVARGGDGRRERRRQRERRGRPRAGARAAERAHERRPRGGQVGAPRDVCAGEQAGADSKRRQTALLHVEPLNRFYIAAGDAACARCEPLRELRDAERAARAARGTQETPDQKWARLETFARENKRAPTANDDKPLYFMWNHYVAGRFYIAAGDAACARPLRARDAARAANATQETPDQKWARLETFARENGRAPTTKDDKPLYLMWGGTSQDARVSRRATPRAPGASRCGSCATLRARRARPRKPRTKSGRASRRLRGRTSGRRQQTTTKRSTSCGRNTSENAMVSRRATPRAPGASRCGSCATLRARRARRAGPRKPRGARLETFARENKRAPTANDDKAL